MYDFFCIKPMSMTINKKLLIVGMVALLLAVGLSGCASEFEKDFRNDLGESSEPKERIWYEFLLECSENGYTR